MSWDACAGHVYTCDYCDRERGHSIEWDGKGWARVCDDEKCRDAYRRDFERNVKGDDRAGTQARSVEPEASSRIFGSFSDVDSHK